MGDPRIASATSFCWERSSRSDRESASSLERNVPRLELRGVRKSFQAVEVIHGVDLIVESGAFTVFVGPSGCGKSTLLRMIAGLEDVTAGEIRLDGERCEHLLPSRRGMAMVFQSYALYPHMSVRENLRFGLVCHKVPKAEIAERIARAANILQIEHLLERQPSQLSGGQSQRVAIGRAIVKEPKAFLFDEPLSNLDAELRVKMRGEIAALHRRTRGHDDLCHPRSGRGDDHGRRDRRPPGGRRRADRLADRAIRPAAQPLRRLLPRRPANESSRS